MLRKWTKTYRFESIRNIIAEYVSMSTIRRVLHENEVQNYVVATKLFISTITIKRSFKWGSVHASWSTAQKDSIILSYLTFVIVLRKIQRKKVRRTKEERYNKSNLVSSSTLNAFVSPYQLIFCTQMHILSQSLWYFEAETVKSIHEANIVPFSVEHYGSISGIMFQQDNCGPYHAIPVNAYQKASGENVVKRPAQGPDLNSIEIAWSMLKRMVRRFPKFLLTLRIFLSPYERVVVYSRLLLYQSSTFCAYMRQRSEDEQRQAQDVLTKRYN